MRRFLLILLLLLSLSLPVAADDRTSYTAEDFGLGNIADSLPDSVAEYLPEDDIFDPDSAIGGYTFDFFASLLLKPLKAMLSPTLRILSLFLGLIIISSALGNLKEMCRSDSLTSVFGIVSGLCVILALFEVMSELFNRAKIYLTTLSTVINILLPVMTAIGVSGGNISSSTVAANGMMLAVAFIETLATSGLFPILQLCFGISAASGMGGSLRLEGITKLIRGTFTFILSFIAAAISAVMSFQQNIAASADSLSMRAVKFAVSGAIPVAGGIAADAVRTVAGSLSLIRNTVGFGGVALVLIITLPVIVEILLTRLAVSIAQTFSDILGLEREKRLFGEMLGLLGFLIAVCVVAALMFIYALTLFARGSVAITA